MLGIEEIYNLDCQGKALTPMYVAHHILHLFPATTVRAPDIVEPILERHLSKGGTGFKSVYPKQVVATSIGKLLRDELGVAELLEPTVEGRWQVSFSADLYGCLPITKSSA